MKSIERGSIKYKTLEMLFLSTLIFFSIINIKIKIGGIVKIPFNSVVVLGMIYWKYQYKQFVRKDRIRHITKGCWLLFLLSGMFTLLWTRDVETAMYSLIDFLVLYFIVITVLDYIQGKEELKLALLVYTLFSFLIAVMGIYENITGNHFHMTYESYSLGKNALGFYPSNTVFYNVNDMAAFIVTAMPINFICAENFKYPKVIKSISLMSLGMSIVFSASRGALLALLIFIVFMLVVREKNIANVILLVIGLVVSGLIFIIVIDYLHSTFWGRFFLSEGGGGRFDVWINTLNNAKDMIFMGVGPGCAAILNSVNQICETNLFAVHNYFIQIFAEFGMIGFLAISFWLMTLYCRIQKNREIKTTKICRISNYQLLALIMFLAISISPSDLTDKPWLYVWLALHFANVRILQSGDRKL